MDNQNLIDLLKSSETELIKFVQSTDYVKIKNHFLANPTYIINSRRAVQHAEDMGVSVGAIINFISSCIVPYAYMDEMNFLEPVEDNHQNGVVKLVRNIFEIYFFSSCENLVVIKYNPKYTEFLQKLANF